MRRFKAIATVLVALALFGACNAALTFALMPVGSVSEVKWQDYATCEDIDTLVVGASLANEAFDVAVLDEELGTSSFTLAAPSQTISESFAAVRTASTDHKLDRVVLGLSLRMLYNDEPENPTSTFFNERARIVGPAEAASTVADVLLHGNVLGSAGSINFIFPWVERHVSLNGPSAIIENIKQKLSNPTPLEAMGYTDPYWHYQGRGFASYSAILDPNEEAGLHFYDRDEYVESLSDSTKAAVLGRLCDYCAEHGIDLVVVSVPVPDFSLLNYADEYYGRSAEVAAFVEQHGATYVDFNLVKPGEFATTYENYFDGEHLNDSGAKLFTRAFARYLALRDEERDTSDLFYTPEESAAASDYLTLVRADASVTEEGVNITARPLASPSVDVEYAFDARFAPDEEWTCIRSWSQDRTCTFEPEQRGIVYLQVRAREIGTAADAERRCTETVYY